VASVALAEGGLRLLRPLLASLPRVEELSIDGRVLGWALVMGLAAATLFGVAPALRATRDGAAAGMAERTSPRWPGVLMASEVALAFVLLAGAGLLLRTFIAARSVNLGYDPRNVLTHFVALPQAPDDRRATGGGLYERLRARLSALAGVRGAATASSLPMGGVLITMDVQPEGEAARRREHTALIDVVSDNYFRVAGIPGRAGRTFTASDREGSTPVAVVSESVARRYFGGRALGRHVVLPELDFNLTGVEKDIPTEIVGVVGNVCVNSVADCEAEHIYLSERQSALRFTYLLVRADRDAAALERAVRHEAYLEAPTIPLDESITLEERTSYLTDPPKRAMWLLSVFAGLAATLAVIGIYSVSAYLAARRRREMGIRMALGATPAEIARHVCRGSLAAAGLGLAAGGAAFVPMSRLLHAILFGVQDLDPPTLGAAAVVLLALALAATARPALRAALTDPAAVLRQE
jgi:predicted permease